MRTAATRFLIAAILGIFFLARGAAAEPPEKIEWLTGEKLRAQLEQKISFNRSGVPLRQGIVSLARSQRVAILLDRRVDPDQKVDMTVADVSLDAGLLVIAERLKVGMAIVGPVVYFGPPKTAERVRTLAALRKEEVPKSPSAVRARFLQPHPSRWADLAEPRQLLTALATECQIEIQGADRIPHDLWSAADLPPASFIDRLTLLAAQFDLTFAIAADGSSVQLADMPEAPVITRSYPLRGSAAQQSGQVVKKLTEALPTAKIESDSGPLTVRGRAEDHEFVETFLAGRTAKRTTVTGGQQVYQLTISMPVGKAIQQLGGMMKLDMRVDEAAIRAAGLSLDTEVKATLKDVTADQLLKAVLSPAGLTFERHDKVVDVRPAKK